MTDQERTREQPSGRRREEAEFHRLPDAADQAARTADGLREVNATLDEILADFARADGPTQVIGSTSAAKQRPLRRQDSSEDFVRAFRQEEGE